MWEGRPDRVILRDIEGYLRGRQPGEVPAIIGAELRRLGCAAEAVETAPTEVAAVERALAASKPGDSVLVLAHVEREQVRALLEAR